ncbi:hypothetical protein K438DRAFT_1793039 [Mycena galopus ATCC 62051]|nr:hypothetical protein K438DRAFT_1793039 [Mycena galopus ATCC 62051]
MTSCSVQARDVDIPSRQRATQAFIARVSRDSCPTGMGTRQRRSGWISAIVHDPPCEALQKIPWRTNRVFLVGLSLEKDSSMQTLRCASSTYSSAAGLVNGAGWTISARGGQDVLALYLRIHSSTPIASISKLATSHSRATQTFSRTEYKFGWRMLSIVAHPESKVQDLTAPPSYIPHLLPTTPNAHRISLLFTPLFKRALSVPAFRSATFDLAAYHTALEAIASLPGTHPLTLDFTFRLTAASLPWDVLLSTELVEPCDAGGVDCADECGGVVAA